jgi:hypothetical protein
VTLSNCHAYKDFGDCLRSAVADIKADPKLNKAGEAGAYGMGDMIPNKNLLKTFFYYHVESLLDIQ